MRRVLLLLALVACKGKTHEPPHEGSAKLPPIEVDWKSCNAALKKAASAPLDARPSIVIDGCKVCGDWKPILQWATPEQEGGPKRTEIDEAMQRCGYCDGNGKQRFLGTLDNARGTETRTPWRQLGEMCKEKVSAAPDSRFMSAPYYALDRIARAAGAKGGETATLLAALELPLPANTAAGTGVVLPDLAAGVSPKVGELAITLIGDQIFVGKMPRATLAAGGVTVNIGGDGYPGKEVKLADLAAAVGKLVPGARSESGPLHPGGDDKTVTVTLLAPFAMPAEKLVPVIAAAGDSAPLYLAVGAVESPIGWQLPGALPYALHAAAHGIAVTHEMTVQNLAAEIVSKQSGTIVGP